MPTGSQRNLAIFSPEGPGKKQKKKSVWGEAEGQKGCWLETCLPKHKASERNQEITWQATQTLQDSLKRGH